MEKIYGSRVATIFTLLVLWTAFGSVFALLLGYSRIPYAAARDGYFFKVFGRLHPTDGFPYVSLLVLGGISIVACFFSLGTVIDALIVTRILVQFIGQVVGVMLLRRVRRTCRARIGCGCTRFPRQWRSSAGSSCSRRPTSASSALASPSLPLVSSASWSGRAARVNGPSARRLPPEFPLPTLDAARPIRVD